MSCSPHTDDGVPVGKKRGRPGKPDMTDEEFAAVAPILALPNHAKSSSVERAALEVGLMRGMHLVSDPRSQKHRRVSGKWIQNQLRKRGIAGKKGLQAKIADGSLQVVPRTNSVVANDTGSRTIRAPTRVGIASDFFGGPVKDAPAAPANQVDSADGAA